MAETYVVDKNSNLAYSDAGEGVVAAPASGDPGAIIVDPGPTIPEEVREEFLTTASRYLPSLDIARRAGLRVRYNTVDITVDIAPWMLAAQFTDGLESADDLQLTLWDDGRWMEAWTPEHGALLQAEILVLEGGSKVRMDCGTFRIDEVEYSWPPKTAVIKATSAFITTALRREKKTRAWEKIALRQIAETIAKKAGLELLYDAEVNPTYARMDQKSRSDLDFLVGLAEREGLRVKTSDSQLIVFSQTEYDSAAGIDVFYPGDGRLMRGRFVNGLTSAYNKAVITYRQPNTKKTLEYTYVPDNAPETGQVLRINERCESLADAERVAENRLMAANRGIKEAGIDIVGNVRMLAGQNIDVQGFGSAVNGAYAIEEATHSLWPYVCGLKLRKT